MKKFIIDKLKPKDLPEINRLHLSRSELNESSAQQRTDCLSWVAFNNPFSEQDEATYYIARDKDRVVGFHGRMPATFIFEGVELKGYYVHDLYVDPEVRKQGMGFWLTMSLAKAIEKESDSFFVLLGMTQLNLKMQRRRNYYEFDTMGLIRLLDPTKYVNRYIKWKPLGSLVGRLATAGITIRDHISGAFDESKVKVTRLQRFDNRFDDYLARHGDQLKMTTKKSSDYLNWKYVDGPSTGGVILAVEQQNTILGYAVVAQAPLVENTPVGTILELMVPHTEQKILAALIKQVVAYFRSIKVVQIKCIISDERYLEPLKKMNFLVRPGKKILVGKLESTGAHQEQLKHAHNWHMSLGESDAFMLSPKS